MKKLNETEKLFANEMDMDLEQEGLFDEMEDEESVTDEIFDEVNEDDIDQDNEDIDMDEEDEDDDDFLELEESEDDDDLFTLKENLRQAKLDEDDHLMTVGKVKAEKEENGRYGPWVKITIPFIAKNRQTGETVTVPFIASRSMDPKSRLYPVLKGIIGAPPTSGFNLKSIEGKKVKVSIEHRPDEKGNVWENVIAVRPLKKKR